ncbi:MAG: OmpA family protein [Sulfurimonas sp.]
MIYKINNLATKMLLASLLLGVALNAGTYDDTYTVLQSSSKMLKKNDDRFMQGEFQEIVRFDMINFNDINVTKDSKKVLENVVQKIKTYIDDKQSIKVTIIGHTNAQTDDANELSIDSKVYANQIQNHYAYSLDKNTSDSRSKNYALNIKQAMLDNNISEDILVVENRRGDDLGFSDSTTEGRDLSNRVMVTMYVLKPIKKKELVVKAEAPVEVKVEENVAPLDSDSDGVIDEIDECPNTPLGIVVDSKGCVIKKILAINFKTDSSEIFSSSDVIVKEFADFLKNNKPYTAEIIGHTDSDATEAYNLGLSQRRAASTKAALVSRGVDASRLTTSGHGELEPLQSNATKEGKAINRRIEVILSLPAQ